MQKEKLRVVSLCSGIGAQERGLKESGCFDIEVVGTSEIDINAIISYAAIHCGLTQEMVENYQHYPSMAEMRHYLKDKNIGYLPEKDKEYNWFKSGKTFEKKVKTTWLSCMLSKNMGDVYKIDILPEADMWVFGFPYKDESATEKEKNVGLSLDLISKITVFLHKAKDMHTLPKYMLLVNDKNLIGDNCIQYFNIFNEIIETKFGYNVQWKVFGNNAFCVYIRKDIDKLNFNFPLS